MISTVLVTETWRVSRFVTCQLPGLCFCCALKLPANRPLTAHTGPGSSGLERGVWRIFYRGKHVSDINFCVKQALMRRRAKAACGGIHCSCCRQCLLVNHCQHNCWCCWLPVILWCCHRQALALNLYQVRPGLLLQGDVIGCFLYMPEGGRAFEKEKSVSHTPCASYHLPGTHGIKCIRVL